MSKSKEKILSREYNSGLSFYNALTEIMQEVPIGAVCDVGSREPVSTEGVLHLYKVVLADSPDAKFYEIVVGDE